MTMIDTDWALDWLRTNELLPADAIAALQTGSSVLGWANVRSDIDFVVITNEQPKLPGSALQSIWLQPDTVVACARFVGDKRLEAKYWTDGQVNQIFAKLRPAEDQRVEAGVSLPVDEEVFCDRLLSAVPLLGRTWLEDRRAQLTEFRYLSRLTTRSLRVADALLEDALGQVESGDMESAVISVSLGFNRMVDALLESHGCVGSALLKWQARRMRDVAPPELPFDQFWAVQTKAHLGTDVAAWVLDVIALCRSLQLEIEV